MNQQKIDQSIWSKFTKQYSLNKTLRFELKPVGKTEYFLKEHKVFKKGEDVDLSYKQAKFYFDQFHQIFINDSLQGLDIKKDVLDLEKFRNKFLKLKEEIKTLKNNLKDKNKNEIKDEINKSQKEINQLREDLYKNIVSIFNNKANDWKKYYQKEGIKFSKSDLKQEGVKFLLSAGILGILKFIFPKEKDEEFQKENCPSLYIKDEIGNKTYIFDSFDNFTTYLTKFQNTRENLYKDDGTSTAVATRIVSNFEIFINNQEIFKEKYQNVIDKIKLDSEELDNKKREIFETSYYYNCLIQKGINEYNKILGEINKKAKEYRDKNKIDKENLPLFKILQKQILGEVNKEEQLIKKTDNETEDEVFVKIFKDFIDFHTEKNLDSGKNRIELVKELITDLVKGKFDEELDGIYLRKKAIEEIAYKWFYNPVDFLNKVGKFKKKVFISLLEIKDVLENNFKSDNIFKNKYYKSNEINSEGILQSNSEESRWSQFLKVLKYEFDYLFDDHPNDFIGYTEKLENKARLLNKFSKNNKDDIYIVKNYCDACLRIYRMMKWFALEAKNEKDIPVNYSYEFYYLFDEYYNKDFPFIKYYNVIRNYITKKPSEEGKIKLNFELGEFLRGWDVSKIKNCGGVVFLKDDKYYLGIVRKGKSEFFDYSENEEDNSKKRKEKEDLKNELLAKEGEDYYLKVNYWQVADANKDIFNLVLMPDGTVRRFIKEEEKDKYWPEEIKIIKKQKSYLNNKEDLITFIDYFKKCAQIYWKKFDLEFLPSNQYSNWKEFTESINIQAYKISFDKIKTSYIEKQINEGNLYFFEIYNKDFAEYKKFNSKKNIHTLYWEMLFSKENLENQEFPLIRLNGGAEVFYRKSLNIKKEPVILNRENNNKFAQRENKPVFRYQRYLEDKRLFHCPITLNAIYQSTSKNIFDKNIKVFLKNNNANINIIGIDRGEKNLLYYCVIDKDQNILDYGSLNEINGVNYFEKLLSREIERQLNRQSWEPVAKIKDLKKGYLSYVIRKISDLIIQYNAIVVLEDLNFRFKQVRGGIERTIYQQFEKALIDKLSYLVFKDKNPDEIGGVLNGYQLVAPFSSFKDLGKQSGVLFYTEAEYTSKTDPLTGYRKHIYISNGASSEKIKSHLIMKLIELGWEENEKSYFFTYNQKDFVDENKKDAKMDKKWTLYSKVKRIRREKDESGYYQSKEINLNQEFKNLFENYGIDSKNKDILSIIKEMIKNKEEILLEKKDFDGKKINFYQRFVYLFNILTQVRNSTSLQIRKNKEEKEIEEINYGTDFFTSPVKPFFSTYGVEEVKKKNGEKTVKRNYCDENLTDYLKNKIQNYNPQNKFDPDAVGAFNIARKGLIILEKIAQNPEISNLAISKKEWDEFVIKNALYKK